MGLHSETIRNLLTKLAQDESTENNVKSMLETQSMVIKNEEIKAFKYPLDNLYTLGAAPYIDDDSAGQKLAEKEWCILLNSCPLTCVNFYDEKNMKSVYKDFMQIAENMGFVQEEKESDSYSLVAGAEEPCKKFYDSAQPRFQGAEGIFRKQCTTGPKDPENLISDGEA